MSERRISIAALAQLLSKTVQPVYAVDAKRRLVWCNEAFAEFFGISPQVVVGQECRWTSPGLAPEQLPRTDQVLSAICPSPEVLSGQSTAGRICWKDPQGRTRIYRVPYLCLRDSQGSPLVLVGLIGEEITPELAQESPREEPLTSAQLWHERLSGMLQKEAMRYRVEHLLGNSPAIQRARRQVMAAAQTKAPVLVVGPSGSGRRFVAQAIHYNSPEGLRSSCITLACQVLDAEAVYSTLKASLRFRPGPGELPIGTIVLLDAEALPAGVQSQIAAELNAAEAIIRLVATSSIPLLQLAEKAQADPNFATWMSTLVIELCPLAQRPEDIPLLAQYFLEEINRASEKQVAGFSPEALDWLVAYPWPGNVAELRTIVSHAHRVARGPVVTIEDLPERISFAIQAASRPPAKEETIELRSFLQAIEHELVQRALQRARGNKAKAARLLGISRPKFLRLLSQLGEQATKPPKTPRRRPIPDRSRLPPLTEEAAEEEVPTFEELDDAGNPSAPPPAA